MTHPKKNGNNRSRSQQRTPQYFCLTIVVIVLGVIFFVAQKKDEEGAGGVGFQNNDPAMAVQTKQQGTTTQNNNNGIVTGSVQLTDGSDIPYYHCDSSGNEENYVDLVLLHGSRFTKEDWKESGIFKSFCEIDGLSVSAMDLPVSAEHDTLKILLSQMKQSNLVQQKSKVALVTPSASGKTMSDWMTNGNVEDITNYINVWIPVAAGSVLKVESSKIEAMNTKSDLQVLAIYGDKDSGGKQSSELLGSSANAKVVELKGTHPCYLDSPNEFVGTVRTYLGV